MAAPRPLAVALGTSALLAVAKFVVASWSGSQAVLASAIDSGMDAVVSGANLWMAREATEPADEGHPWGHGKIEGLASLAQGLVLVALLGFLAFGALGSFAEPARPPAVGIALLMMGVSVCVAGALTVNLSRAAARSGSLVLHADAAHYRMDLYTGSAVIVGLAITPWAPRADALATLAVCAAMARDVVGLMREAVDELMDRPFDEREQALITGVLCGFEGRVVSWHDLRTRRSGPHRFVQVHVVLPATLSFAEAHRITDDLEHALRASLTNCDVLVHADVEGEHDATDTREVQQASGSLTRTRESDPP